MASKKIKKNISNFLGLEYLTITGVPMIENSHGEFFDVDPLQLERIAAWVIITHELPIRGKELKLLRGALDLSLAKFARHFDKDAVTIRNWENSANTRLSIADELMIRLFMAKELNITLPNQGWDHLQEIARKNFSPLNVDYSKTA